MDFYLREDEERVIYVTNEFYKGSIEVKIAMGKDMRVSTTSTAEWAKVIKRAQLLQGEMALFWIKDHMHCLSVTVFSGIPINK